MSKNTQIAVFGGGCFWCSEAVFGKLKGVTSAMPGYSGGNGENPTYEQVCSGNTGHAEVVKITYNPDVISYSDLLTVFFAVHDPNTLNRQGNDVGTQYRSVIFYTTDIQKQEAEQFIKKLDENDSQSKPIVTEVKPLDKFYEAEKYHQQYFKNNPEKAYCQIVINPKLEKLQAKFADLLSSN